MCDGDCAVDVSDREDGVVLAVVCLRGSPAAGSVRSASGGWWAVPTLRQAAVLVSTDMVMRFRPASLAQ